jgi:hypothetical protein
LKAYGSPSSVWHNSGNVTVIINGGQGVFPPGTVWIGPGYEGNADNFGVIRFTLPSGADGSYQLDGTVHTHLDGSLSGDSDFHILHNGEELFGQQMRPSSGTNFNETVTLVAGDTIDFVVGRGVDGREYGSADKVTATLRLLRSNHAPIASLAVTPLFDALPGVSNLMVISANGSNAAVALDGRLSTDPDHDSLQYSWSEGSATPFATGVRVTNKFGLGTHTVTLAASDGSLSGTASATFDVITLSQATAAILAQVNANADPAKPVPALGKTLTRAIDSFDANDLKHGLNELYSFQKATAKIGGTLARSWIAAAQQIIDAANANTRLQIKLAGQDGLASALDNVINHASGEVQLTLTGDAGLDYVIEVSDDLVHWTTLKAITNSDWSQAINDPDAGSFSHRFYRIKPVQ